MKPFTSKHCTQYLTKSSPLNQGLILPGQTQEDVARGVKKAREAGLIGPKKEKATNTADAPAGYSERARKDMSAREALKAKLKSKPKKTGYGPQNRPGTFERLENRIQKSKERTPKKFPTKESPLNQGYITKAMRENLTPEEQRASIRRMIEKREKIMGKPEPIIQQVAKKVAKPIFQQAAKKVANKKIPTGFKKGSEADLETKRRLSSTKYKK